MTETLRIALAQLNPVVGDVTNNMRAIEAAWASAKAKNADLVVTGEMSIAGYQPDDLILREAFVKACMDGAERLAIATADGPALIIGLPWKATDKTLPYNAAALLRGGRIEQLWFKYDLPNYGIFDDRRVFAQGSVTEGEPFLLNGTRIGVAICEDMWSKERAANLQRRGAEILIAINASPYETDKAAARQKVIGARVGETGLPVIYVNQIGGQDETVFDGGSFVMAANGKTAHQLGYFAEQLVTTEWKKQGGAWACDTGEIAKAADSEETIYRALMLGIADYVNKNKFPGVLLGMSGGIDSALVAALAVDALGKDKVTLVMMPSPYTSRESLEDAAKAATLLGCEYKTISIEQGMSMFASALKDHVKGRDTDLMDQNIQSRLRGLLIMALSNATGRIVLATGNKSEMATGYATLYGDMCGGFAPIKDVYKTLVFKLSKWRNLHRPQGAQGPAGFVMPERIITRPPTAELKAGQVDQDTLPPYDQLDDILDGLIEREQPVEIIAARGHHPDVVQKVLRMLRASEYKRRQAPPGTKITTRAFGRERRYPITNGFKQ